MADPVSPTESEPKFDVTLTDGTTTLGFVLYNATGNRDRTALKRYEVESPMRYAPVDSQWADRDFPYTRMTQANFSGGGGIEDHGKDKSRFYISENLNTQQEGKVFLGGRCHYPNQKASIRDAVNYLPEGDFDNNDYYSWVDLYEVGETYYYLARQFTTDAAVTAHWVWAWLKKVGTPGALTVYLYSDVSGSPGVELDDAYFPESTFDSEYGTEAGLARAQFSDYVLAASTTYWVVFRSASGDDASDHWKIATWANANAGKDSNDASSWAYLNYGVYFRILENDADRKFHFAEYQRALYAGSEPLDDSAGDLYLNGYKGAPHDNTGNLDRLIDTGEFGDIIGKRCVVQMLRGHSKMNDLPPWRRGIGGTADYITLYQQWNSPMINTADWYAVLGTDHWEHIDDGGKITTPISDLAVGTRYMLIATRDSWVVKMNEKNLRGSWLREWGSYLMTTRFLQVRQDPVHGEMIYFGGLTLLPGYNDVERDILPADFDYPVLSSVYLDTGLSAMDEQVITNVTSDYAGDGWREIVVDTDAFGTGIIATHDISPAANLTFFYRVYFKFKSDKHLDAGDLQFLFSDVANCATPLFALDFPSIEPNDEQYVIVYFDPTGVAGIDEVISYGLQLTDDKNDGNYTFNISFVKANVERDPALVGGMGDTITGLELYDDPEQVYVFTDATVGFMQNDKYTKIPLREIQAVRSMENGWASTVSDVYLVFSMAGTRIQRYFRQNIEDISPVKDDGLPTDRLGTITSLVSYPGGRIIATINGASSGGYSSIMMFDNNGWHTMFVSPWRERIYNAHIQAIPSVYHVDRLWFSMGSDVCWIPISLNPLSDIAYDFAPTGTLITSYYDSARKDKDKVFEQLTVYSEDANIYVYYQVDNDTDWTYVGLLNTSPSQTLALSSGTSAVQGKRIRFKFVFELPADSNTTPILNTIVLDSYVVGASKFGYVFTTKISEKDLSIDLEGDEAPSGGEYSAIEAVIAKLDEWSNNMTRLTLNSVFSPFNDKTVWIPPTGLQPMTVIPDEQIEEHFAQLTVNEF